MLKICGSYALTPSGELCFPRLKPVLFIFYPGDFTPVCTRQLCNYRDHYAALKSLSCDLIGISSNTSCSQKKMLSEHQLPFPLLADPEKKIIKPLGMLAMGIIPKRGYALIDRQGQVRWTHADVLPFFYIDAKKLKATLEPLLDIIG